ncbi:hypothetical protein K4K60_007534 [Colletotrichum sp. SAR11_57]|nr:hypothetical protein K4K60_007534 [Colletotrichum sp. SAR11_57]
MKVTDVVAEPGLPADGSEPHAPEIYLFPNIVPGFDLRRKKWVDVEVDQIQDVVWNEHAFKSLVADEDMKTLILALSRIQLALRYEKLEAYQRKQIWKNFFERLKSIGEEDSIDFDDISLHIDELTRHPMNGRQIRNTITTARQLAKFMGKKMVFSHLQRTIAITNKFDQYLADVREADVEEHGGRGLDGRYSDEYFARSDQIR